jgi:predicted peroxiredoxin
MEQYLEECAEVFLKEQGKLFDEPVVETIEEAKEFLEDCFAQVFENISDVRAYLDEEGMDVSGVSDEELADELEVFAISDGRYFVVEA